jgi:hypothetical protein
VFIFVVLMINFVMQLFIEFCFLINSIYFIFKAKKFRLRLPFVLVVVIDQNFQSTLALAIKAPPYLTNTSI